MTSRSVWVLELANMDVTPLDRVATTTDAPTNGAPSAPSVSPSFTPAVVVSVLLLSGMTAGLTTTRPFVELTPLRGDGAAYAIVALPGSYAPMWNAPGSDNFGASTAAFLGVRSE